MRPGEFLLLLTNLLTFFIPAVPRLRAVRWTRFVPPSAPLITGAQALTEGVRPQMIPAYTLIGIFFLVWLLFGEFEACHYPRHSVGAGSRRPISLSGIDLLARIHRLSPNEHLPGQGTGFAWLH